MRKKEESIRILEDKLLASQRKSDERLAETAMEYDEKIEEKDRIISELKNKLAHAESPAWEGQYEYRNTYIPDTAG